MYHITESICGFETVRAASVLITSYEDLCADNVFRAVPATIVLVGSQKLIQNDLAYLAGP